MGRIKKNLQEIETNLLRGKLFHLVCAMLLVVHEVRSICTVLQLVFSDPLTEAIPSLACHICQCKVPIQINLEPLVYIVCFS